MKLLFSLTLLLSVVSNLWGEIYSEKQSPKLELVPENFLKNLRILILFFFFLLEEPGYNFGLFATLSKKSLRVR